MAPLLSVVIPFYNGEKYVKNIAKAFKAQSIKDFELICVDDGSKDNTLKLLETFKEEYKELNVKVVHQENRGVSVARNTGLENVEGQYISFVDCDDYITSDYVETLVDNKEKDFDLFIFQQKRIRRDDSLIVDVKDNIIEEKTNLELLNEFSDNPTKYGVYNMFIKKDYLDKHSFRFAKGYKYYEDYEFMLRVFTLAKNIIYTKKQLYLYMLQDGSAMQSFTPERISCIKALEDLNSFFEENLPLYIEVLNNRFISRIYWSIMWQAAIAFDLSNAKKFANMIDVKEKVKPLCSVNSKKVKYSSLLLEKSLTAYIVAVKILGGRRTKIKKIDNLKDFEKVL